MPRVKATNSGTLLTPFSEMTPCHSPPRVAFTLLYIDSFLSSTCNRMSTAMPQICGYEYVHLGKMMEAIKNGMDANEAVKKFTGSYGRTTAEQGVVKAIDPRKE